MGGVALVLVLTASAFVSLGSLGIRHIRESLRRTAPPAPTAPDDTRPGAATTRSDVRPGAATRGAPGPPDGPGHPTSRPVECPGPGRSRTMAVSRQRVRDR